MVKWPQIRLVLLGLTFSGVLLGVAKVVLYPVNGPRAVSPYRFPESVSLPEWQFTNSQPLSLQKWEKDVGVQSGQKYNYGKNNIPLEIEIHYTTMEVGNFHGRWIKDDQDYKSIPGKIQERKTPEIGYYGLLLLDDRQYLVSCINPRGQTTIKKEQFRYNRNTADLQVGRMFLWAIGQGDLQDRRCLWTKMSVPISGSLSPDDAVKLLETTWVSWYQWWQPQFPPL